MSMRIKGGKPSTRAPHLARCLLALLITLLLVPAVPSDQAWADEPSAIDTLVQHGQRMASVYQAAIDAGEDPAYALSGVAQEARDSNETGIATLSNAILPSEYYLTNAGAVTDVKFQNPWGACWSFAGVAALESSYLKASGAATGGGAAQSPLLSGLTRSPDLSEHTLAWFNHEAQTEQSAGSQAGEGTFYNEGKNTKGKQVLGGMPYQVESAWVAWQCLLNESTAPYTYYDENGFHTQDGSWWAMDFNHPVEPAAGDMSDTRNKDWSLDPSLRTAEDTGIRVSETIELPSPATTDQDEDTGTKTYRGYNGAATEAIKQTLMDTGAVSITYLSDNSMPKESGEQFNSDYFSYDEWCQYNNSLEPTIDHSVTIVGWDDNYSAANFTGTIGGSPSEGDPTYGAYPNNGNGAWLVKNSWGSDSFCDDRGYTRDDLLRWGIPDENGYSGFFWLSYYDHTIDNPVAYRVASAEQTYDNNYQYDYLGVAQQPVTPIMFGDIAVANVFTTDSTEVLEAVSTWTFSQNATVHTKVYLLDDNATSPTEGKLVAEQNQAFPFAGFHTIPLDTPIQLSKGQRFAVVESIPTTDTDPVTGEPVQAGYLNLESAYNTILTQSYETSSRAIANDGESYCTLDGGETWDTVSDVNEDLAEASGGEADIIYGSALIKAFTNEAPPATLDIQQGTSTVPLIAKTYDGQALTVRDVIANAAYGSQPADEADLSFSYVPHTDARALPQPTAGLPTDAGTYDVTVTLAEKTVDGVLYAEASATTTLTIAPAAFSFTVGDQNATIGSGLASLTVDSAARGVNGQAVRGTLAWFGDAAHAQALPTTYTFAGEPGAITTLHWTFTPDASETNYVAEPATGDARFTLVAAQASGEHPAASGHSPTGSDAPSPLVRTGDRIAALPWVAATVAATAAATACVLRRRKRQR